MPIIKTYSKYYQWNYVPSALALYPLYVCIFLICSDVSFYILLYGGFPTGAPSDGSLFLITSFVAFFLIITVPFIPNCFKENWRFQRKAYNAPPVRLITEVEYLLKEEKINYEKEIVKSKLFSGFEKTFFIIKKPAIKIVLRTTNQFVHVGPITDKNRAYADFLKVKIDEKFKCYEYSL